MAQATPSKTDTKHAAQAILMQRVADALLVASEDGTSEAIQTAMRTEAKRIGKMFGYLSWSGIWR